jgi:hypothetical protein
MVPATHAGPRHGSFWAIADQVSRVLLWLAAAAVLVYYFVFAWAYHTGNDELLSRLARWIPRLR